VGVVRILKDVSKVLDCIGSETRKPALKFPCDYSFWFGQEP